MSGRILLCTLPTPLHRLEELSRRINRDIWIKRDDLTGFAMGGNKARKAEFLLADALQNRCDMILTAGAIQSNHARIIATGSRKLSLECHLFLKGQTPDPPTANVLLDLLAEATIHTVSAREDPMLAMETFAEQMKKEGRNPYIIPVGGSNEIGAQGYASGFQELDGQLRNLPLKPTVLVFCSSSGGTHAGILVGKAMTRSQVEILGIRNDDDSNFEEAVCRVANGLARRLRLGREFHEEDIHLNSNYVGEGYGVPSMEGKAALKELWQWEGILLDPVYTSKTMAGLIDLARKGKWANERIVFLHTGGTPSSFAFPLPL
jgi:D-cysteine desulfhydrase